jgi:hypothetical protein
VFNEGVDRILSSQGESPESRGYTPATRVVASTLGVLVGLAGIDHGLFEVLQGNVVPDGLLIAAIGPEQRFWAYGMETVLTVVPNFLLTGVLAIVFGVLVTIWAAAFLDRKRGAGILMLLSLILFLVGGGFAPIVMSIVASLAATRIGKPLTVLRKLLPPGVRRLLSRTWQGTLIAFVTVFLVSVEIAVFGWPLTLFFDPDVTFGILNTLSFAMLGLMLLSVLTALAHDVEMGTVGPA